MTVDNLIQKFGISDCIICEKNLPKNPRPILQASRKSRILVIGQAPGIKAHDSCKPWNDPSGDRLRDWLGVSKQTFYDEEIFALMPMAFCYPGRGKSGDLPPSTICAPTWHQKLRDSMDIQITLLIGQYAQQYYLKDKYNLTKRVEHWKDYLPQNVVLPHPSPRNNIWLKRHAWFEQDNIPAVRQLISDAL